MRIHIHTHIGVDCVTYADGALIYHKILPALQQGKHVQLIFDGVQAFASPFFNAAIGQLLKNFTPERLNELLLITGLNSDGKTVIQQVIKNAKEYYSQPAQKNAVDAIIKKRSDHS